MAGAPARVLVRVLVPVPARVLVPVLVRAPVPARKKATVGREAAADSGPRCTTAESEAPGEAWATGRREPAAAPVPSRGSARAPSPRRLLRLAS